MNTAFRPTISLAAAAIPSAIGSVSGIPSSSLSPSTKLAKTLYRSLLRKSGLFERNKVLSSLLHRNDSHPDDDRPFPIVDGGGALANHSGEPLPAAYARDLSKSYSELVEMYREDNNDTPHAASDEKELSQHVLMRRLIKEAIGGSNNDKSGEVMMRFPCQIEATAITDIIQREFRASSDTDDDGSSFMFDDKTRRHVAFTALKILNEKIAWAESLGMTHIHRTATTNDDEGPLKRRNRTQAAVGVSPLFADYLQSGTYLIAHPLLTGYFSKTVIILLDHHVDEEEDKDIDTPVDGSTANGRTYGLIINRSRGPITNVLQFKNLPPGMETAFGDLTIRDGGPVLPALQMIHSCPPQIEDQTAHIGGLILPMVLNDTACDDDEESETNQGSAAFESSNAVYFKGDIARAAQTVIDKKMDKHDFSFFVGASCWDPGQLDSEIDRGFWMPAAGPPDIAFLGKCRTEDEEGGDEDKEELPHKKDLWLSMMCAMGEDEGDLAHLAMKEEFDEEEGYGAACDDY